MKRAVLLFLSVFAIIFSASFPPLSVNAAGKGSVSLSDTSGERGEEVVIRVELTQNPGLISLRMLVSYPDGIILRSVENGGILNGWTAPSPTIASPYTLRWVDALATANNTVTGTIATLRFRITDTAEIGANTVTVEVLESRNKDGEKIAFSSASATITVTDPAEQPSSETVPETQPATPSTSEPEPETVTEEESMEIDVSKDETEAETDLESSADSLDEAETEEEDSGEATDGREDPTVVLDKDSETEKMTNASGWILPVVLGGVLLIGLAGGIFFAMKKKKKK